MIEIEKTIEAIIKAYYPDYGSRRVAEELAKSYEIFVSRKEIVKKAGKLDIKFIGDMYRPRGQDLIDESEAFRDEWLSKCNTIPTCSKEREIEHINFSKSKKNRALIKGMRSLIDAGFSFSDIKTAYKLAVKKPVENIYENYN